MSKPLPSQSPSLPQTPQLSSIKQELSSITQILHLTHHRNKNQHRLTKWWKQFSILRRNTSKLLLDVENLETAEKFSTGGDKGGKYVKEARERVEQRVEFLETWVLERAFV